MPGPNKVLVYCSKDSADWDKAVSLLNDAGVENRSWHVSEPAVAGCGAKIDIRSFGNRKTIPKELYKIEVPKEYNEKAAAVLNGKVQPVRYYGVG